MKKIASIILAAVALTGCGDNAPKQPTVSIEQVSNVCSNMVRNYIQGEAEKNDIGEDVRFIRYEGLDELIFRQCKLTTMRERGDNTQEFRNEMGRVLDLDVNEFASEQMTFQKASFVKNSVRMSEKYAQVLSKASTKSELSAMIEKIKNVK